MDTKKDILMAIGQNPTIKDTYPKLEEDYLRLESLQMLENKERTELLNPVRLRWLCLLSLVNCLNSLYVKVRLFYILNLDACDLI